MKKDIEWLNNEVETEIHMWDGAEGGWAEESKDDKGENGND